MLKIKKTLFDEMQKNYIANDECFLLQKIIIRN